MRWDQSTAPNIVRIVNPKVVEADDEVLIAQQDNSTPVPARKKIGGPEAALDHYMSGSGDAVEFPFDLIDTSTVEPSQVPAIQNILRRGQPGIFKIQTKLPFSTPNYKAKYAVGNITLNINGMLVLDEDGSYSFEGELGAEPGQVSLLFK